MLFSNSKQRVNTIYKEYPKQFWIIVGANFIDRIGGGLIYPFFALYITKQFQVGMTEVGVLFALFSISDLIGNMIGGALTDFLGRKTMIIFGLIVSALTVLAMGLVQQLEWFFVMGAVALLVPQKPDGWRYILSIGVLIAVVFLVLSLFAKEKEKNRPRE